MDDLINKSFEYKNFFCEWDECKQMYLLFTPEDANLPAKLRKHELECQSAKLCKQIIDCELDLKELSNT